MNPARTRHCDRGRRPHDRPLATTSRREGAAGRPGSQETSLRPQSRYALVERGGPLASQIPSPRRGRYGPAASIAAIAAVARRPAAPASAVLTPTSASRARGRRCSRRRSSARSRAHRVKGNAVLGHERRRRARRRDRRRMVRLVQHEVQGLPRQLDPRRDADRQQLLDAVRQRPRVEHRSVRDAAASGRPRPVVRLSGRRELQLHEQSARRRPCRRWRSAGTESRRT